MGGFVQNVVVYIVQLLPVVLDVQNHTRQLVLMEELIQLIRENNIMLRFICNNIIAKDQIQDTKDFLNNVAADMYVETLTRGNK